MTAIGAGLEVIVTSPLARARRTAEIVADELGLRAAWSHDDGASAAGSTPPCCAASSPRTRGVTSLMVVGHEPDFSVTVAELIGGGRVDMKKGGLARVDVRGPGLDGGVLAWLLTPALLTGE